MGYLGGALTDEEAEVFVSKYNKPGERYCIKCGRKFMSKGSHNRKCSNCTNKEEYLVKMNILKEPIVYRTHANGVRSTAYHAEVGE